MNALGFRFCCRKWLWPLERGRLRREGGSFLEGDGMKGEAWAGIEEGERRAIFSPTGGWAVIAGVEREVVGIEVRAWQELEGRGGVSVYYGGVGFSASVGGACDGKDGGKKGDVEFGFWGAGDSNSFLVLILLVFCFSVEHLEIFRITRCT